MMYKKKQQSLFLCMCIHIFISPVVFVNMSTIQEFLNCAKTTLLNNINSCLDIHFVIGSETCDLDSTVSTVMLAYFMDNCKSPLISETALIVPVLNISKENFLFHVENCIVLRGCGISLDSIVYRDQVDFEKLLKTKQVTVSLVDHQVLSKNDEMLEPVVVQIIDHKPFDESTNWKDKNIKLRIEKVGSCATLIADEILQEDESLMTEDIAFTLYQAILFDTRGFHPIAARTTALDFIIASKLEKFFHLTEHRAAIYHRLWAAHDSVLQLSAKEILLKDLEVVEKVPVVGLPLLIADFVLSKDSYNAIEEMSVGYKVPLMVLIGLQTYREVKCDVAIYWREEGEDLKNVLLSMLKNSEKLKGYDFGFEEVEVEYPNIVCLKQNNIQLSRKQINPIIIDAVAEVQQLNK